MLKKDEARLQRYSKYSNKVHSSLRKKVNRAIETSNDELKRIKEEKNVTEKEGRF